MAWVPAVTSSDVVPVTVNAPAAVLPAERALNHAVSGAVRLLNDAGHAGAGREITFSVDRATHLPVVRVVDTDTKEVVHQWPSDYVLQLAEDYKQR